MVEINIYSTIPGLSVANRLDASGKTFLDVDIDISTGRADVEYRSGQDIESDKSSTGKLDFVCGRCGRFVQHTNDLARIDA